MCTQKVFFRIITMLVCINFITLQSAESSWLPLPSITKLPFVLTKKVTLAVIGISAFVGIPGCIWLHNKLNNNKTPFAQHNYAQSPENILKSMDKTQMKLHALRRIGAYDLQKKYSNITEGLIKNPGTLYNIYYLTEITQAVDEFTEDDIKNFDYQDQSKEMDYYNKLILQIKEWSNLKYSQQLFRACKTLFLFKNNKNDTTTGTTLSLGRQYALFTEYNTAISAFADTLENTDLKNAIRKYVKDNPEINNLLKTHSKEYIRASLRIVKETESQKYDELIKSFPQ